MFFSGYVLVRNEEYYGARVLLSHVMLLGSKERESESRIIPGHAVF